MQIAATNTFKRNSLRNSYRVTQKDGTEPAFRTSTGQPPSLPVSMSTSHQENHSSPRPTNSTAGSGWPSFTQPLVNQNVGRKKDRSSADGPNRGPLGQCRFCRSSPPLRGYRHQPDALLRQLGRSRFVRRNSWSKLRRVPTLVREIRTSPNNPPTLATASA